MRVTPLEIVRLNTADRARLALVVIDCHRHRYSRYIGAFQHRIIEGRRLTADEVEHFHVNPADFIDIHFGPEFA